MQLIRIKYIEELKKGDRVAISSNFGGIETTIGSNINLTTGIVANNERSSVLIKTDSNDLILTNIIIKMQSVYLIKNNINEFNKNEIKLERKLRKAEKLNRRYKAILTKRFNVSEEELKNNFKSSNKSNNEFYTYRKDQAEMPCIKGGNFKNLSAKLCFKRNSKKHILCEITVYKGAYDNSEILFKSKGLAICHKDDEYDQEIGELIASTKALKEAICKLY